MKKHEEGQERDEDRPERFPLNVRQRVETDLPAQIGGFVAAETGHQRVGRFVGGDRQKKHHIPQRQHQHKFLGSQVQFPPGRFRTTLP